MEGRYFVVTRSGGFRAPLREARFLEWPRL